MIELTGAVIVLVGIFGLFALDSIRGTETSKALWIPVVWVFIAGSRPLSFWLFPGMGDSTDRYVEGSPFDRNIFTALIISALVVLFLRARKVGTLLRQNWPILLFLLYCGLSVFWSDFPEVAFKRWIRVVGDVAMVLVVLTDSNPSAAIRGLLARIGFAIIPASILFDIGRGVTGRDYHFGLTTNKNMFGLISMIVGIGAVWRFLQISRGEDKDRRRLIAYGSIVAMVLWCLWTANSTTSATCFVLGSALIIATSKWGVARNPAVVHLSLASVTFLAVYAAILNPNVGIASAMGKDPTLTGRTDVWQAVIGMTPSPWLGAGFDSFWLGSRLTNLWNIFPWRPNEAHNGYLEIYLNLGWTGVILLAVLMVTGYQKVVRGLRQDTETGNLRLAYFAVAVVYNLTEAGFRTFDPMWIFLLLSIAPVLKPASENLEPQIAASLSWDHLEPSLESSSVLPQETR